MAAELQLTLIPQSDQPTLAQLAAEFYTLDQDSDRRPLLAAALALHIPPRSRAIIGTYECWHDHGRIFVKPYHGEEWPTEITDSDLDDYLEP